MKYSVLLAGLLTTVFLTGCVSVKYSGKEFAPVTGVKIYENRVHVDESYVEIGKCVVYGRYDRFSKEALCEKIRQKAEAVGADVVLIYAHQVVPEKIVSQSVGDVWNDGAGDATWVRLDSDFASYGKIGRDSNVPHSMRSYMRVIRAEFLKNPAVAAEVGKFDNAGVKALGLPAPDSRSLIEENDADIQTVSAPADEKQ